MTLSGTLLVGEFDGVGVAQPVGREASPHTGLRGDAPQLGAGGVTGPGPSTGRTVDHAQQRTDRHPDPQLEPRAELLPSPTGPCPTSRRRPPLPWRTSTDPGRLEVVLADGECLVDAESRPPEQHDQRTHARAVGSF